MLKTNNKNDNNDNNNNNNNNNINNNNNNMIKLEIAQDSKRFGFVRLLELCSKLTLQKGRVPLGKHIAY